MSIQLEFFADIFEIGNLGRLRLLLAFCFY